MSNTYFLSEVGFFDVEFESDALQIINTLGDMELNLLPFGHILEEARSNAASPRSHSFHHAFQECNVVVDAVAKSAMSIVDLVVWQDEPPSFIVHLIRMDQHFIIMNKITLQGFFLNKKKIPNPFIKVGLIGLNNLCQT